MEFCIIVLSYNHPELTARAVSSAKKLFCENILLIHNGSEAKHIKTLQEKFPEIQHFNLSPNRGYSGGLNFGLIEAFKRFNWAIVLTNDSQLKNLPSIPQEPCILAPKIFKRNSEQIDSIGAGFIPEKAKIWHCKSGNDFNHIKNTANQRQYIPGTAFLIHKEICEKSGYLQENLCIYWDDVEFSQRIKETGFELMIDESWHVSHGLSKTGHSNPLYSLYYFQRNRKLVSWKYCKNNKKIILISLLLKDYIRLGWRYLKEKKFKHLNYLLQLIFHSARDLPKS